jgi:transposase
MHANMADTTMAVSMLEALALSRQLIADKGIEAVVPDRASRAVAYPFNRAAYRRRNVIERMFGYLKNWKWIATRYDRLAMNYLDAVVLVVTVTHWPG